ncbi:MAG: dihydrofolate reductase family protein [Candidatus Nanopelagicales bacterium]
MARDHERTNSSAAIPGLSWIAKGGRRGHADCHRIRHPRWGGPSLSGPLAWANSTLISENLAAGVTAAKGRHDEIHVIGSLNLLLSLLRLGLVARLSLWIYPLLLGEGKRVFAAGIAPTALSLTESVTYSNGVLHLSYQSTRPLLSVGG